MIVVSFYVMIYYNVVIAWSVHYLFSGMQKILPWTKCNEWWNTATTKVSFKARERQLTAIMAIKLFAFRLNAL